MELVGSSGQRPRLRERSPNFPAIPLADAMARARRIRDRFGADPLSQLELVRHWEVSEESSRGRRLLAALLAFGLVVRRGAEIRLSALALRVLDEPPDSSARRALLREAALGPPLHGQLWLRFEHSLPPDPTLRAMLLDEYGFVASGLDAFLRQYVQTLDYAGLRSRFGDDRDPRAGESRSRRDVFTVPEGEAVLRLPEPLSSQSALAIADWLALVQRKLGPVAGPS